MQSYSTTVSDTENGTTESVTFTWDVNNASLVNPGTQTNPVGASINLQISDPNADANSYTASDLPSGLGISTSGLITGTITGSCRAIAPRSATRRTARRSR